jgi:hypothetical protein
LGVLGQSALTSFNVALKQLFSIVPSIKWQCSPILSRSLLISCQEPDLAEQREITFVCSAKFQGLCGQPFGVWKSLCWPMEAFEFINQCPEGGSIIGQNLNSLKKSLESDCRAPYNAQIRQRIKGPQQTAVDRLWTRPQKALVH